MKMFQPPGSGHTSSNYSMCKTSGLDASGRLDAKMMTGAHHFADTAFDANLEPGTAVDKVG